MKIVNAFLVLMFLAFAAVQYNDPDPFLWIAIYLAMAVLSGFALVRKYYPRIMLAFGLALFIYAGFLTPGVYEWYNSPNPSLLFDDVARMQYQYIEEAREFLGLIICLVVLGLYFWLESRKD